MSHEIEIVNGRKRMAFNGEKPWHFNDGEGTCKDVTGLDLTPMQMLEEAECNWKVYKVPSFAHIDQLLNNQAEIDKIVEYNAKLKKGKPKVVPDFKEWWQKANKVELTSTPLVRDSDGKVLDIVTPDWEPVQNEEAMEFFNGFVAAGEMTMETVGSLKGGQIIWGLARINEAFDLFKGDTTQAYLLFSNFHKYGNSTGVQFTPVRVVCWNTLSMALGAKAEDMVKYTAAKFTHRRKFQAEAAKELIGISKTKLLEYKEKAAILGSKKAKNEDIVEYLKRLMPGTSASEAKGKKPEDTLASSAKWVYDAIDCQPGHQYAAGSWWQPFNAYTFFMDHEVSRTGEQRLKQGWFGTHRTKKLKALDLALEFAKAS
jgi:phage/plasmid-like protein (TIGR03299 family)